MKNELKKLKKATKKLRKKLKKKRPLQQVTPIISKAEKKKKLQMKSQKKIIIGRTKGSKISTPIKQVLKKPEKISISMSGISPMIRIPARIRRKNIRQRNIHIKK